ncbi:MAG: type II CRISPR RNA-guided endonuclease Cas9 [Bacteroidales bacterium]|nr:type II CRISPR RNA-guided endonuclease Cas9 [Bacteroidales bacterium]
MKRILGLDLGTNSIGWALIERNFKEKQKNTLGEGRILEMGSRIIPMSQDVLDKFGQGQSHSQTSERTDYRGVRRLRQRHLLRRERLHRILNIIDALPEHYANKIDFENKKGQFINDVEVKLNYKETKFKKFEFLFKDSFNEMLKEFEKAGQETKIPYDWTIYYLRKKALTKKISLQELAWILLNFNQKRGYYQLRGEEAEEDKTKLVEFHALKVINVAAEEPNYKNEVWYNVKLENGWIYRRKSKNLLDDCIGKVKEFIVTTPLDENGNPKKDKEDKVNRSFRAPKEDDWDLVKTKTQNNIEEFNETIKSVGVGSYIFDELLINPKQKINGKFVKTIERSFYKDELIAILEKQKEYHSELMDKSILEKCVNELYPNNYAQQNILKQKNFTHLFVNDIIFYQRPLKSKKSLIDGCKYESRTFYNKEGVIETKPIKVIHKSNPLYQEFRLWQFVENMRIYQREISIEGKRYIDYDVTLEYLPDIDTKVELFELLNDKGKITQKQFFGIKNGSNANFFIDKNGKKLTDKEFRWNYVEDKEYPLNETRALFISKMSKHNDFNWINYLTQQNEIKLWHLLYSISDKKELEIAFKVEDKHKNDIVFGLPFQIRKEFIKAKPFKNDYGALSEKAIKKLLPLMRMGEFAEDVSNEYKYRIDDIYERLDSINHNKEKTKEVADDDITRGMLKSFCGFNNEYSGLKLHQASYAVYGKHAEAKDTNVWKAPKQLDNYIKEFKQHSLRNPIVEQVVTETLRVVKDIWQYYGDGKENFFDEIHVELGRDMKNPADERKRMTENITKNQNTNQRIRVLLREFKNQNIEGVIPESPNQQEKLRIFENDILSKFSEKNLEKEEQDGVKIAKVIKSLEPTNREIEKYRLWLEQKYRSPYTGQVIQLSKLFTTDYEIEHIFPQTRYFDNSLGNKIICEAEVNRFKDKQTAFEMISKNHGRKIDLGQNESVSLFTLKAYQDFVSQNFEKGSKKQKILLSEDIPENFISRQLNDTRYISKVVKGLLSNIVREDDEQEVTSKNLVSVTGSVTSVLKNDWGLNEKWNEIVEPRFKRMNEITNSNDFGFNDQKVVNGKKTGKKFFRTDVPLEFKKDFNKKRIDHRHHAMDALVVACADRNHVSYLNNEHAKSDNKRYDLRNKLRRVEEIQRNGNIVKISNEFFKPWQSFPVDAKNALDNIVVSFKQNRRVQTKATNRYWSYYDEKGNLRKDKAGNPKKELTKQEKGNTRAVRKPMHDPMPYGKVKLWFDVLEVLGSQNNIQFIIDNKIKKKVKLLIFNGFTTVQRELKKNTKAYNKLFSEIEKVSEKIKELKTKNDEQKIVNLENERETNINKMRALEAKVILNEVGYAIEKTHFKINNEKYGKRQPLETLLSGKDYSKTLKSIYKIGDCKLQQELIQHLNKYFEKNNVDFAFSPDGIDEFNKIRNTPVYSAISVESGSKRYKLGSSKKYVEATEGNNLFFTIYWNENEEKRNFDTIPFMEVVKHQKWRASLERKERDATPLIPIDNSKGKFLFYLSPNDLVYVPAFISKNDKEKKYKVTENVRNIDFGNLSVEQKKRLFNVNDFSGVTCYFTPNSFAKNVGPKELDTSFDSKQSKIFGISIKDNCIKLKVDILGNIVKVGEY